MADITNRQLLRHFLDGIKDTTDTITNSVTDTVKDAVTDTITDTVKDAVTDAITGAVAGINHQLGIITDQMVTKDDLKKELERFATKDDLQRLAAKNDLEHSAINQNINNVLTRMTRLERKVDSGRAANVKHHLETRKMIGDLSRQHW